jgi:hypothetical protein
MKKLISIALIGIAAGLSYAALDTAQTYHDVVIPATAPGYTITGSAVDTIDYKGFGTVVVSVGVTANTNRIESFTNIVTIQKGTTSTGAWTTVTAVTNVYVTNTATYTRSAELPIDLGAGGRYLRGTVTNKNDAAPVAVWINAPK